MPDTAIRIPGMTYELVHDGSVTGGLEMVVSPVPAVYYGRTIPQFITGLVANGAEVDATCGFHVHVEAGEFGALELRRLILLYSRFEDLFYQLVRPGRDVAQRRPDGQVKAYCARWRLPRGFATVLTGATRPRDIRKAIVGWLYKEHRTPDHLPGTFRVAMRRARGHKYEQCRYVGLNLHSWFERGTVEYRHHEGTTSPETAQMWGLWCVWFTELASILSDAQVAEVRTVDELLGGWWVVAGGTRRVAIPSDVTEWVRRTLVVRRAEIPAPPPPVIDPTRGARIARETMAEINARMRRQLDEMAAAREQIRNLVQAVPPPIVPAPRQRGIFDTGEGE